MLILAIESSTSRFSVALSNGRTCIAQRERNEAHSASENCAVLVSEIFQETNSNPSDLSYLAVNNGPGSFTGLRAAHSFSLGLLQQTETKMIGVSAFELLFQKEEVTFAFIKATSNEIYFCEREKPIQLLKKETLAKKVSQDETIYTNQILQENSFLPEHSIITIPPHAIDLCNYISTLTPNPKQQKPKILYFHHFKK